MKALSLVMITEEWVMKALGLVMITEEWVMKALGLVSKSMKKNSVRILGGKESWKFFYIFFCKYVIFIGNISVVVKYFMVD